MITDWQTNTIYFSELLKTDTRFTETSKQLIASLEDFGANFEFLPDTKDIWARDYMPIQINNDTYIEYRFDPDYLQKVRKGYRDLKTYPDIVCDTLKLKTKKSDLIMDGGNFVKSTDCVILTDKIVKENNLARCARCGKLLAKLDADMLSVKRKDVDIIAKVAEVKIKCPVCHTPNGIVSEQEG